MFRKACYAAALLSASFALGSHAAGQRPNSTPVQKETLQPDKVLYDKAVTDIRKKRFEIARLTLQTLINTYDSSEFLARAHLAIAESWFKQGGTHEVAQARNEYRQVVLLYPDSPEAKLARKMLQKLDKAPDK
jgi:outer membrane protein assembly factor BamD